MKPTIILLIFIFVLSAIFLFFSFHSFQFIGTDTHHSIRNVIKTKKKIQQAVEESLLSPSSVTTSSSDEHHNGEEDHNDKQKIIFDLSNKNKNISPKIPFSTCFHNSSHYSIKPNILKASMREEMNYKTKKINKLQKKRKFPANHASMEFIEEECLQEEGGTPECAMWNCFPDDFENANSEQQGEVRQIPPSSSPTPALKKCCHEHKALKETALWVIEKLESHNIRYFLSTGSALGAIRHNGVIIPWDTDVDMAIFPEDADRVKEIFLSFKHEHFFHADPNGKPMYWIHHSKDGKPKDGPHVEIFFEADYTKHKKELLPLQRCDFYGKNNAWCPKTDMFEIWFGKNWRCYGGGHYHNDGRCTIYHLGKRIEKKNCKQDISGGEEEECNVDL